MSPLLQQSNSTPKSITVGDGRVYGTTEREGYKDPTKLTRIRLRKYIVMQYLIMFVIAHTEKGFAINCRSVTTKREERCKITRSYYFFLVYL